MKKKSENFYKKYSIVMGIVLIVLVFVFLYVNNEKDNNISEKETGENVNDSKMDEIKNIAILDTTHGVIKINLYLEESPITAGNFKKLVEEGFYDGVKFHRVIQNFMIQGGDPLTKDDSLQSGWGTGGPGYAIEDEFIKGLSNVRGSISMANSGPNSGGSQFFINVADNTLLDWDKEPSQSKHPVFGMVVEGMGVVDEISRVSTVPSYRPSEHVVIEKAYME